MSKVLVPSSGNDIVYTPDELALSIVHHFLPQINPKDTVLEPCFGGGAFLRAFEKCGLRNVVALELEKGQDFFEYTDRVDWIITNPPWSKARDWFVHCYEVADNVVNLITINHLLALKRRLKDMAEHKFAIKEVLLVDTPPTPWPQSGFQLGAIHTQKNWKGKLAFGG